MDVAGLCDICRKKGDMYSCHLCGKRICSDCVTVSGVCKLCAGGKSIKHDEGLVKDVLKEKGIDPRY